MLLNRMIQILGACAAGFLGVVFGIGGGIILVPILLYTGVKPKQTIATSLSIITVIALSGTLHHLKMETLVMNNVNLLLVFSAVAGAIIGSMMMKAINNRFLTYLLTTYFYVMGLILIFVPHFIGLESKYTFDYSLCWIAGFPTAIISAMLGIGGGAILTPVLLYLFRTNIREVIGVVMPFIFFLSLTASIVNLKNKFIDLTSFVLMLPAAIVGTFVAYYYFYRIEDLHIQIGLGILLVINALIMTKRYIFR
jgi:uncharacterized membrane protein YfcA